MNPTDPAWSLSRRRFLALSAVAPAALLLPTAVSRGTEAPGAGSAPKPVGKIPIGLELYSVRDELARDLPATLAEAAALFETSELAAEAFGDDVVAHYLNNARVELTAFNAAVTDWERKRGFERL